MSSLKDIMDVDVEPFESQAYRRSKEALQQQASRSSIAQSSETPSPPIDNDNNKETPTIKRRRSNRSSHLPVHPSTSRLSTTRRRSSAAGEDMDFSSGFQAGGSNQASLSGSPQQSSRGSEPAGDIPVKYTPVTGRISRAKKGVPVHTCDICRPVKTFTRAEHLRRHQLSHQKPAYPCTFPECERAFHRPDLLARHLHRHESQGEKAYKSGDRSRASSSASESRTPSLKVETPSQVALASVNHTSPSDSITPRSTTTDNPMTASTFSTITGSFPPVNYSPGPGSSHKRSASQAQLQESESYPALSPGAGPSRKGSYDLSPGSGPSRNGSYDLPNSASHSRSGSYDLPNHSSFAGSSQPAFNDVYGEVSTEFPNYTTTPQLPLLRIPEETYIPGLSYTQENSPWCSSASDSTYSTQSDGSRSAQHWVHRDRSASMASMSDWPASATVPQWPCHGLTATPQDMRSPGFESILDQYDAPYTRSPRMTPPNPSRQLLDVPNSFGSFFMESVGTPALSTYSKPLAQHFPASPTRITDPGLDIDGRKKELVVTPQLGSLSIGTNVTYTPQSQLDIYIASYFQHFHQFFPIIHRPSFNSTEDSLLSTAMAAIGTQYHHNPEARTKGSELNDACRKSIDLCLNWSTHTMQAILLTELFTRFRGRKTVVRLTRHFEALYSRLLNCSGQSQTTLPNNGNGSQQSDVQSEWFQWVETEARQRLLAACFMFDVHQAIYHQQPRFKARRDDTSSYLYLPCSESLWNASSTTEWQSQQSGYVAQPLHMVEQNLSTQYVLNSPPFTHSLLICSFATRLPVRKDPTYPDEFFPRSMDTSIAEFRSIFPSSPLAHVYLALHHTPLHDLLAIAGDTWVFSQKITPPSAFHTAQTRLKTWSSSLAAAQATHHACRILSFALSQPFNSAGVVTDSTCMAVSKGPNATCICDYWSLYVSALICWAFGHRHQLVANSANGNVSRNNSSSAVVTMDLDDASPHVDKPQQKALAYANGMLAFSVDDLVTGKATIKRDTSGVIDAVLLRLEAESVGNKSSILVDAVGILNKIRVGGKGKWF